MAIFAPAGQKHESACETIFCGSFSAFVMRTVTFRLLQGLGEVRRVELHPAHG